MNCCICIKIENDYIQGEGDYWISSPNVSSSSNFSYFYIYNIYIGFLIPKIRCSTPNCRTLTTGILSKLTKFDCLELDYFGLIPISKGGHSN